MDVGLLVVHSCDGACLRCCLTCIVVLSVAVSLLASVTFVCVVLFVRGVVRVGAHICARACV